MAAKHLPWRFSLISILLIGAYWGTVELTGQFFAVYGLLPAPIWPAASIAFVAVWFWGRQAWLGIFIGATLANWLYPPESPPLILALIIAFGSNAAIVLANHLLKRFCGNEAPFNRLNSVLIFLATGAFLQALIAATIGILGIYLTLGAPAEGWFNPWFKWVIADAAGVLFFAPILMLFLRPNNRSNQFDHKLEYGIVLAVLVILTLFVYWLADAQTYAIYALPFILIGPLAWAALRLSQLQAISLLLVKEILAFAGTILGLGVLNASGDPYPIGTLGIMLVSTAIGVHVVNALVSELRSQKVELELMNQQLELRVSERTSELVASEARMRHLATTDELTGLANRRAFWKALNHQVQLSRQLQQPLSLIMLDLDYFKAINDEHGHAAGDHALRSVSRIMQNLCENHQLIGRLGGEEFAIILPAFDLNQAQTFAETIRLTIQNQAKHPQAGNQLTVSIGIAQATDRDSSDSLTAKADKALYQAKNSGRNCSCVEVD